MRPLPYPSKGLVLEPNISAAPCLRVYYGYNAPVFENDEEIYDPLTHQYVIPSIGQATHHARVGDNP